MKQIYSIMAFAFAALVILSLWIGLSEITPIEDETAGGSAITSGSDSATTGQGR